ncbi:MULTISPECIES: hypothetical protein [unclassified Nocardia]|uniref:hypothetical protein n=1 Tax=unclassified Nocardia TaxID=2637762 RepID=UPI001CE3E052|nr:MULTISPECIES: hypothetical protein [unclassified Nocardia]
MSTRAVHFVGSYPADSPDEAMRAMLDGAGARMRTLPNGETDRYELYVLPIIDDLVRQGALEVKQVGRWSPSWRRTIHRVPPGKTLTGDMMDLGYLREAEQALPAFTALRREYELPGLTMQVGMPTDLSLTFVAVGAAGVRSHRRAFADASLRHIPTIRESTGDNVVFQLEATAELVLMALSQPLHRQVDARFGLAAGIAAMAAAAPAGTRFGVHMCLGSLNNKAATGLRSAAPLVDLANSIARQWPSGRKLEYVHGPFAAGAIPPSTKPEFYEPLSRLALPQGTAFYAGFVHDAPTEAEQLHTLHMIEERLGRPVDGVASPCGLGRRPRDVADAMVARAGILAGAD